MNGWSVAIGAAGLVGAGVFFYVGDRLRRRSVPDRVRVPAAQFTIWWWGLAADAAVGGIEGILWGFGALNLAFALTCEILGVMAIVAALWGLVGYLTYLYTGRSRLVEWSLFYAVLFVTVLYYEFALGPVGVTATAGVPSVSYAHEVAASLPVLVFLVLVILVPECAGIALYFSLIRRTADRTLRYRIALVTLSLVVFFGVDLTTLPASLVRPQLWSLLKGIIEAGSSLLSLIAYLPPEWIRRRLRIASVATVEGRPAEAGGSG
jgi:hypothetical protein